MSKVSNKKMKSGDAASVTSIIFLSLMLAKYAKLPKRNRKNQLRNKNNQKYTHHLQP